MDNRIKDISKLKLAMNYVLLEVKIKKSPVLAPGGKTPQDFIDYCVIVNKHQSITNYEIGDIVIDAGEITVYNFKGKDYAIVRYDSIKLATSSDNFDFEAKKVFSSDIIKSC